MTKTTNILFLLGALAATVNAGEFNRCKREGMQDTKRMWDGPPFSRDCSKVSAFRDDCEELIKNECTVYQYDDYLTKRCKRGRAAGIRKGSKLLTENECTNDQPDSDCADLGKAAAEELACKFCSKKRLRKRRRRYPASCRYAAYGACEVLIEPNLRCYASDRQIADLKGKCWEKVHELTGDEPHHDPVAHDDTAAMSPDERIIFVPVLQNDTPAPGEFLTVRKILNKASNGECAISLDLLEVAYTPDPGFIGVDKCVYEACDSVPSCDSATLTIAVTNHN